MRKTALTLLVEMDYMYKKNTKKVKVLASKPVEAVDKTKQVH